MCVCVCVCVCVYLCVQQEGEALCPHTHRERLAWIQDAGGAVTGNKEKQKGRLQNWNYIIIIDISRRVFLVTSVASWH